MSFDISPHKAAPLLTTETTFITSSTASKMSSLPQTMQSFQQTEYGPPSVLALTKSAVPAPSRGQVLLKVHATSPHKGDIHLIHGTPFLIRFIFGGIFRPAIRTPGTDAAGTIVATGEDVSDFAVGERVFGDLSASSFGAFAEYAVVDAQHVARIPPDCGFRQACTMGVSALAALQAVRDHADVKEGMHVLVSGASGGVGSYAVQMVKAFGGRVTALCRGEKCEVLRRLGVDVFDSEQGDVVNSGAFYDVVIDAAMYRSPLDYVAVLKEGGRYVGIGGDSGKLFRFMLGMGAWMSKVKKRPAQFVESSPNRKDLEDIAKMVKEGKVVPLIDEERFGFEDLPEALKKIEERRVVGKIAVDVVKES